MERSEIIILWSMHAFTGIVTGQSGTDMKNLYAYLFTSLEYNKDIRPQQNQSELTPVSVDLLLTGFHGLDEAKQQMGSVGILTIRWRDEFLFWTPSTYGGVSYIDVPQGLVWKPDIQVRNSLSSYAQLGGSFMNLRVFSTGDVMWTPYKVFNTKCRIDIRFFPFDRQECSVILVTWASGASTVTFTKGTNGMQLDMDSSNSQWTMSNPTADVTVNDNASQITFKVTLDRKTKVYILNIVIPMLFLIILDVFTFCLPNDCGEKISYSITVFLAISIFMTIMANLLPPTSNSTSYLEIYIMLNMSIGTLILMISAISYRIHNRTQEREIPSWIKMLTILSWKLQCRAQSKLTEPDDVTVMKTGVDAYCERETNAQPVSGSDAIVLWKDVTSAIDFYMFWFFLFVIFTSTVIHFGLATSR